MSRLDYVAVTRALKEDGLEFHADEETGVWTMSFEFNARQQSVMLSAPSAEPSIFSQYLLAVSFISSAYLEGPLDSLSPDILRTVLKAQSEVLLAKFDYWSVEGKTHYVAVSPCSIVAFDGHKLRMRLESCADLAARIRAALLELYAADGR
ncbi:MAG TPA: hypothetical protein VH165_34025 [Kofleriaceae bacterium]|jgi:hypothetical protein|nr:hypothetical protein [Kofleriaceae bacterium]